MKGARTTIRILLLSGFTLMGMALASAQIGPRRVIQIQRVDFDGTIIAVRPGMIRATTSANETWTLVVPPRVEVRLFGKGDPSLLKPGNFVRFIAQVDKRRSQVAEKVAALTLITPSQQGGHMLGVFYPNPADPPLGVKPALKGRRIPGAKPPEAAPMDPGADAPRADPHGGARSKNAPQIETFDIRAKIIGFKGSRLQVMAPNRYFRSKLYVDLAEDLDLTVNLNTYSYARAGDTVSAWGLQIRPQAIEVRQMLVELTRPLGAPQKKDVKRARPRPSPDRARAKRSAGGKTPGRDKFEVAEELEKNPPPDNNPK